MTKEDWAEWMRNFAVELIRESPSAALRACYSLAQVASEAATSVAALRTCLPALTAFQRREVPSRAVSVAEHAQPAALAGSTF